MKRKYENIVNTNNLINLDVLNEIENKLPYTFQGNFLYYQQFFLKEIIRYEWYH
jgi:hypothetical protein